MKRLLLELGGKGAGIVFDDADLKTAITGIIVERVGVPLRPDLHRADPGARPAGHLRPARRRASRPPPATSRSATRSSATRVLGPVITEVHRDRVEGYVASGRDEGGTVVAGGERPDLDARASTSPRR